MSINISMAAVFTPVETLSDETIRTMIAEHQKWLANKEEGKRADFSYKNLEGYDFHGVDLSGADFTGAGIAKANFSGAKLEKARMNHAVGDGVDLSDADLSLAEIKDANICHSNMERIKLAGADMTGSILWDNNMKNANLRAACCTRAQLCDCALTGADVQCANFLLADVDYADFQHADCKCAMFLYMLNAHWANFEHADLTDADFHGSNIYIDDLENATGGSILPVCPEEGSFVAWWICRDDKIVKFEIPERAFRRTVAERLSVASEVKVLAVYDLDGNEQSQGIDLDHEERIYQKGKLIKEESEVCFYISRQEVEDSVRRRMEERKEEEREE